MGGQDVIVTIATDSADMYQSRIAELTQEKGKYSTFQAALDFEKCILGQETQNMKELGYHDQKAIHNLKYFTWVEQQGKTVEELNRLWNDTGFWPNMFNQVHEWDVLIEQFNERTGLLKKL